MPPEERKKWEVTRSKGYHRFLLTPDLASLLIVWSGTTIGLWVSQYGLTLAALKTGDFWSWAGVGLIGLYIVNCFINMFIWRKNEDECRSGIVNEKLPSVK